MANMHDCLFRAAEAREVTRERAEEATKLFDQMVEQYSTSMPRHQAEARAAADLKEASRKAGRARFHAVINQLQAMRRLDAAVRNSDDPELTVLNLIAKTEGSGYSGESLQSMRESLTVMVNARLREVLAGHSRNLIGNVRKPAQFRNIVRELHGEDTGDVVAKEMAEAVAAVREDLRRMFNGYGGDIGKLADYGLPHTHDAARMRKMGREAWIEEIAPRLAWHRIEDKLTGKPFAEEGRAPSAARQREFLNEIYENITTNGWNTRAPSMATGGRALYNQRADHRVLHFASADDWMAYNKAFGNADPFSAMIGSLHGMAQDVAAMRVLGPNPRLGLEYAAQVAEKRLATGEVPRTRTKTNPVARAKAMLAHMDGRANTPVNEFWASVFGGTRQVLTGIQLGSATLSAVTDMVTTRTAARVVGMKPNALTARTTQLIASNATRETAARMGFVADSLADAGSTAARFVGETFAPEVTRRVSDFTLRASGLTFWTDMNRTAFQMEFAGYLAENAGKQLRDVEPPLRKLLEDRGFTADEWDALRADDAMFRGPKGETFITPFHWLEAQTTLPRAQAEGIALRLQAVIQEQLEFAVPTASPEGRALLMGEARPGTFAGELLRSGLMYKSFALSLTLNQYRRFMAMPTPLERAAYAAKMAAGLTIMGAVAVQLKELAKGRDPRPMDEGKFWLAATFQGGGLGIFGDFFSSQQSRIGGGFAQTLAGPVVSFADSVADITVQPALLAAQGEDPKLGRGIANFIRYNTPVGSSLWYQRLAFDRMVADQVQLFLDPEAEANWRRQERRRARDYGNETWWGRGEMAPDRMPEFSTAIGGSQ